jgi:hypothetical protein
VTTVLEKKMLFQVQSGKPLDEIERGLQESLPNAAP